VNDSPQIPVTRPKRPSAKRLWIVLAVAFYGSACAIIGLFGGEQKGPTFPHAPHAEELDCTSCHLGAEDEVSAGLPENENGCMLCHEDIDEEKPFEKTVAALLVDGKPYWLSRPSSYGEGQQGRDIKFSHGAHYEAEVECRSCHGTPTGTEGPDLKLHGGKRACLECHAKTERGNDCSVCHEVLRANEPPPDHENLWQRLHGVASRTMIPGMGETTCAQCHTEDSCNQCHQLVPPQDHTNFWRRRGHGLTASIDRSNCAVCHDTDYCVRCHQATQPVSHRGAWGPPANRHCTGCHLPPVGLGCGVCHRNFPMHPPGPPPPANNAHMNANSPFDCLVCHVGLSHGNPGGDCRFCHQ